jgi:hypothetical protein
MVLFYDDKNNIEAITKPTDVEMFTNDVGHMPPLSLPLSAARLCAMQRESATRSATMSVVAFLTPSHSSAPLCVM